MNIKNIQDLVAEFKELKDSKGLIQTKTIIDALSAL
jgi:hypothetical protein